MLNDITEENVDAVLAFLPLLENKDAKLYKIETETSFLDPYQYFKNVDSFINTLYQKGFVISFVWTAWQDEAKRLVNNPKLLDLADLCTLQKLLTTHVRKERFCSGHLAGMIENGHILALLKRLEAIRADMVIENADKYEKSKMNKRIAVIQGDITQQRVDAIVNAANNSLLGGGGVDGAIHKAAGAELLKECRLLLGCATGEAKITKGYKLPARWVIHTVGPIWYGGNQGEDELLASCYRNCLALALGAGFSPSSPKGTPSSPIAKQEQYQIKTIAFSAISTGVYGFPVERAARIAATEIQRFLKTNNFLEQVILVCFSKSAYNSYLSAVKEVGERQLD